MWLRRRLLGARAADQPAFEEHLDERPRVGESPLEIDIELVDQGPRDVVGVLAVFQQGPDARTRRIEPEVMPAPKVEQNGLTIELAAQHVFGHVHRIPLDLFVHLILQPRASNTLRASRAAEPDLARARDSRT